MNASNRETIALGAKAVAVFRTAALDTHIVLYAGDDGTFTADCTGCGLRLGPERCGQVSAEQFANAHAGLCHKLPPELWPGEVRS